MAKKANEKKSPGRKPGSPNKKLEDKLAVKKTVEVIETDPEREDVLETLRKSYKDTYERYIKNRYATVTIRLDKMDTSDSEVLEFLNAHNNKTQYIIGLIKNDMLGIDKKPATKQKIKVDLNGFVRSKYYRDNIAEIEALTDEDELEGYKPRR